MPEVKCPKCSAAFTHRIANGVVLFDCNTAVYPDDKVSQSYPCKISLLESTIARLRKALEDVRWNCDVDECRRIAKKALEETK